MNTRPPALRSLPSPTRAFLLAVMGASATGIAAASVWGPHVHAPALLLASTLALCAATSLFEVLAPGNLALQVNLVFFTWGALLLPAWAVGALAVASFAFNALPTRTRWYVAGFNAANYALAGIAAGEVARAISPLSGGHIGATAAGGLLAAAVIVVAVNHLLVVGVLHFAHGRPLRAALGESWSAVPLDLALASSGAVLAAMWTQQHLLAVLAAGPLLLMYRGLYVPMLRQKSQLDPKTGLLNFEHFSHVLHRSLGEAQREGGHVGVLMIDLDEPRPADRPPGHLADDRLVRGVADAIAAELRPSDLAARVGGEEFCVVLPGAATQRSMAVAEAIRQRMAGAEELHATVSIGVAVHPEHGLTPDELLDAADAAVGDARLGGRNRVTLAVTAEAPPPVPAAAGATPEAVDAPPAGKDGAKTPAVHVPGVAALLLGTVAVAAFSSPHRLADRPGIFAALVLSVVALDLVRIDVFARGRLSPAAVPSIALAMLFGPLGPICAEAVIALTRMARRAPLRSVLADFGMLGITGAATAGAWTLLAAHGHAAILAAGVVAGVTSYLVNATLLTTLVSLQLRTRPIAVWREGWAWLWPHYAVFGLLAGGLVLGERALGGYGLLIFGLPVAGLWLGERQYVTRSRSGIEELRRKHDELEAANASLRAVVDDKQALVSRMHRSYLSTVTSLARTIEAKDPYTGGHTERVARIACLVAEEMGFDAADVRAINVGAVIHDIGKIGVPDRVLLKPGSLAPEELAEIRRHPEISSYILADLDLPPVVKQMVRSHHERYGGGGYPDGLVGEEIPLAARILSVADSLDAMTSDRPYRSGRPLADALAEIDASAGEQFCPRVVAALHTCLGRAPRLAEELFGAAPVLV